MPLESPDTALLFIESPALLALEAMPSQQSLSTSFLLEMKKSLDKTRGPHISKSRHHRQPTVFGEIVWYVSNTFYCSGLISASLTNITAYRPQSHPLAKSPGSQGSRKQQPDWILRTGQFQSAAELYFGKRGGLCDRSPAEVDGIFLLSSS